MLGMKRPCPVARPEQGQNLPHNFLNRTTPPNSKQTLSGLADDHRARILAAIGRYGKRRGGGR